MARSEEVRLVTKCGRHWAYYRFSKGSLSWSVVESIAAEDGDGGAIPGAIFAAIGKAPKTPLTVLDQGQSLLLKELAIPVVSAAQQHEAILHEVEAALPFPIEETRWDVVQLDEDTIEERYLLLAARETDVSPAVAEILAAATRATVRLETLPTAFANTVLTSITQDGPLVSVYLSAEASFILFTGGTVPVIRSLNYRSSMIDEASVTRLKGEISRAIAVFRRQESRWRPGAIHLLGPDALAHADALSALNGMTLATLMPEQLRDRSTVEGLERVGDLHLVAVVGFVEGLDSMDPALQRCDLRTLEARVRASNRVAPLGWGIAAGLLLLAGLAWMLPPWLRLQQVENALADVRAEAAPLKRHAAALGSIREETASRLKRLEAMTTLADSSSVWNNTLVDLQTRLLGVENVWFDQLELNLPEVSGEATEDDVEPMPYRLVLTGRLLDPNHPLERVSAEMQARVNDLIDRLENSRYITTVTEKRFEPLDGGLLQFSLTMTMSGQWKL